MRWRDQPIVKLAYREAGLALPALPPALGDLEQTRWWRLLDAAVGQHLGGVTAAPEVLDPAVTWLDRAELPWCRHLGWRLSAWIPCAVVWWKDEQTMQVLGDADDLALFLAAYLELRTWIDRVSTPGDDTRLRWRTPPWDHRIRTSCERLVFEVARELHDRWTPLAPIQRGAWDARERRWAAVLAAVAERWPEVDGLERRDRQLVGLRTLGHQPL